MIWCLIWYTLDRRGKIRSSSKLGIKCTGGDSVALLPHPPFQVKSHIPPFQAEALHRRQFENPLVERAPMRTLLSQFFSRSFESILPTSLIYITLSTLGCSPRRPAADTGTDIPSWFGLLLTFPCTTKALRPPVKLPEVSINSTPVSVQNYSKGILRFIKKRQLFPGLRPSSSAALGYPMNTL
jgi:hypothetical protein